MDRGTKLNSNPFALSRPFESIFHYLFIYKAYLGGVTPDSRTSFFADWNSALPRGAMPYHVMAAKPMKALIQLKTNATMPRAVNLKGISRIR